MDKNFIKEIYDDFIYKNIELDILDFIDINNGAKFLFISGKYGSGKTTFIKYFFENKKINYFYNEIKDNDISRFQYINNNNNFLQKLKNKFYLKTVNSTLVKNKISIIIATITIYIGIIYQPINDLIQNHSLYSFVFLIITSILSFFWLLFMFFIPKNAIDKRIKKAVKYSSKNGKSRQIVIIDDLNRHDFSFVKENIRYFNQIFENSKNIKVIFIGDLSFDKNKNEDGSKISYFDDKDGKLIFLNKYIDKKVILESDINIFSRLIKKYTNKINEDIKLEILDLSLEEEKEFLFYIANSFPYEYKDKILDLHEMMKLLLLYDFLLRNRHNFFRTYIDVFNYAKFYLSNNKVLIFKTTDGDWFLNYPDDIKNFEYFYKQKNQNKIFLEWDLFSQVIFLDCNAEYFEKYINNWLIPAVNGNNLVWFIEINKRILVNKFYLIKSKSSVHKENLISKIANKFLGEIFSENFLNFLQLLTHLEDDNFATKINNFFVEVNENENYKIDILDVIMIIIFINRSSSVLCYINDKINNVIDKINFNKIAFILNLLKFDILNNIDRIPYEIICQLLIYNFEYDKSNKLNLTYIKNIFISENNDNISINKNIDKVIFIDWILFICTKNDVNERKLNKKYLEAKIYVM